VTAKDFETSWKAALNPQKPSLCAYLFYPIKNAEDYVKRRCSLEDVGIRALNAQTLQVVLEENTPYFLALTAFPLYLPVPSHHAPPPLSSSQKLVNNGPFHIEEVKLGDSISLKKNKTFWNAERIRIDSIHISIVSDEMTALQLFENKELDILGGALSPISIESLQHLKQSEGLLFAPMLASTFCTFNTELLPFSNFSIRKAFALAIDWESLSKAIHQMGPLPAENLLSPAFFNETNTPLKKEKPKLSNKERAKELFSQGLKELNISMSELEPITLYYKSNSIDKKLAQMLQKEWECLGISIAIEQYEPKALLQKLHQKNYQLSLGSWIAQFHDPISILERFKDKTNPKNYPNWENRAYVESLNMAAKTIDPSSRNEWLKKAEKILENDVPLIPLYHWQAPILTQPRVKSLSTNATGAILVEYCDLDDSF
jgi:oligopeptide transport system substrate-binding protein